MSDATETDEGLLAIPLAELRPALEAILMVSDQPLDATSWPVSSATRVRRWPQHWPR